MQLLAREPEIVETCPTPADDGIDTSTDLPPQPEMKVICSGDTSRDA
jgi:hypothetical protein